MVGANNTRKSRFLRHILGQKANVIYAASGDLNEAFLTSKLILKEVFDRKGNEMKEALIQLSYNAVSDPGEEFEDIKNYIEGKGNLSFSRIQDSLNNIHEMLMSIDSTTHFDSLWTEVRIVHRVAAFMVKVYEFLEKSGFRSINEQNYSASPVQYISFITPSQQNGHPLLQGSEKLTIFRELEKYLSLLKSLKFAEPVKPLIYIPVLRTSRALGNTDEDLFANVIKLHHFKDAAHIEMHTGLQLYKKVSLARNGSRKDSRNFHQFERFIGEMFFQSPDLHIVAFQSAKNDSREIRVSIPGDMEDIAIQDLGDGVQAAINLLFPVFTAAENSWIFIDEPENHLHPGFQNIFMSALLSNEFIRSKNLRFFINTHSNHILANALLDSSRSEIFVFSRRTEDSSDIASFNGNEINTLEALGVLNTSVLISNCTVWVEGVTDRFYLQAFLSAFARHKASQFQPTEGFHYSFVEYAGKNLTHYEFDHELTGRAERKEKIETYFINSNVFLLADSDFNPDKHQRYMAIKRQNFIYEQTEVPEVENLLPDAILKDFLMSLGYEAAELTRAFPIRKHTQKLGKYFAGKITRKPGSADFESSGGTLSSGYKQKLARFVQDKLTAGTYTWVTIKESQGIERIVSKLYSFIKEKNKL